MSSGVVDLVDEDVDLDESENLLLFETVTIIKEKKKTEKKTNQKKTTSLKQTTSNETVTSTSASTTSSSSSIVSTLTTSSSSSVTSSTTTLKPKLRRVQPSTINRLVREVNSLLPVDRELVLNMLLESSVKQEANDNKPPIEKTEEEAPMVNPDIIGSSIANSIENPLEKQLFALRLELGNLLAEQSEMRNKEKKLRGQIKKAQKSLTLFHDKSCDIFKDFSKSVEEVIVSIFPTNPSCPQALHPLALFGSDEDMEKCEEDPIIQQNISQSNKISLSCPLWSCSTFKFQDNVSFDFYTSERRVDPNKDAVIIDSTDSPFPNSQSTIVRSQSFTSESYQHLSQKNYAEIDNVSQLFSQVFSPQDQSSLSNEGVLDINSSEVSLDRDLKQEFKSFKPQLTHDSFQEIVSFVSVDFSISSLISFYLSFVSTEGDKKEDPLKSSFLFYLISNKFKEAFFSPRNLTQNQYKKSFEELFSLFYAVYTTLNPSEHSSIQEEVNVSSILSPPDPSFSPANFGSPLPNLSKADTNLSPALSQMIDLISPQTLVKSGDSVEGVNINKIQRVLDLFAYNDNLDISDRDSTNKNEPDSNLKDKESPEKSIENTMDVTLNTTLYSVDQKNMSSVSEEVNQEEKKKLPIEDTKLDLDRDYTTIKDDNGYEMDSESSSSSSEDDGFEEDEEEHGGSFNSCSNYDHDHDFSFNSDCEYGEEVNEELSSGQKQLNISNLRSFLVSSVDLYQDILTYQPLNLDVLYEKLKEDDFKLPQKLKLLPLLDELDVFVSVQRERSTPKKRKKISNRPSKRLKKS